MYMFLPQTAHFQDDARARSSPQERATTRTRDAQSPTDPGLSASQRRRIVRSCVDPPPEHTHPFRVGGGVYIQDSLFG